MRNAAIRSFWLIGGLFFVALAFVGVVLPLVPTTPFLLVAAFCFARSSKPLHNWLYQHKWFGPLLTDWEQHGAINPKAKGLAIVCLIATPLASLVAGAAIYIIYIQIVVCVGSGVFILTRPNGSQT